MKNLYQSSSKFPFAHFLFKGPKNIAEGYKVNAEQAAQEEAYKKLHKETKLLLLSQDSELKTGVDRDKLMNRIKNPFSKLEKTKYTFNGSELISKQLADFFKETGKWTDQDKHYATKTVMRFLTKQGEKINNPKKLEGAVLSINPKTGVLKLVKKEAALPYLKPKTVDILSLSSQGNSLKLGEKKVGKGADATSDLPEGEEGVEEEEGTSPEGTEEKKEGPVDVKISDLPKGEKLKELLEGEEGVEEEEGTSPEGTEEKKEVPVDGKGADATSDLPEGKEIKELLEGEEGVEEEEGKPPEGEEKAIDLSLGKELEIGTAELESNLNEEVSQGVKKDQKEQDELIKNKGVKGLEGETTVVKEKNGGTEEKIVEKKEEKKGLSRKEKRRRRRYEKRKKIEFIDR